MTAKLVNFTARFATKGVDKEPGRFDILESRSLK